MGNSYRGEQARGHPTDPAMEWGRLRGQPRASSSPAARHICGDTTGLRPSQKSVWKLGSGHQGPQPGRAGNEVTYAIAGVGLSRDRQPQAELKWDPLMQNQIPLMPFILLRALH